jgi:hypothetical protein
MVTFEHASDFQQLGDQLPELAQSHWPDVRDFGFDDPVHADGCDQVHLGDSDVGDVNFGEPTSACGRARYDDNGGLAEIEHIIRGHDYGGPYETGFASSWGSEVDLDDVTCSHRRHRLPRRRVLPDRSDREVNSPTDFR